MDKNAKNFSEEDAKVLANTPAGKQLIAVLKKTDPNILQNAIDQASNGNLGQAKDLLSPLLASKEVQALLRQIGGK